MLFRKMSPMVACLCVLALHASSAQTRPSPFTQSLSVSGGWSETRDATGLTDTLGGGHAHVGMMIYQGTNFPAEYRGKLFTTNLHGRRVNIYRLDREGSGYVGRHTPDFMKSDDAAAKLPVKTTISGAKATT